MSARACSVRVLGAARWPARYLLRHPGVIDELASAELYATRFDPQAFMAGVSSRSSEVIHAGLYYPPGSRKARWCVRGKPLLFEYAQRHGVAE